MTTITPVSRSAKSHLRDAFRQSLAGMLIPVALCSAYIQGAVMKLFDFDSAIGEMAHFGLQPAPLFAAGVCAFELVASAMVISGFHRRLAAYALAIFTLAATGLALQFWTMAPGPQRVGATNAFFEHLGLAAAFILLAQVDARRQTSKKSA